MIDVSNAYKLMMQGHKLTNRIEVTILSGEDVYNLIDDDIVKGSLQINWRASNNGSFSLGTCYASSMSFSSFISVVPEVEGQYITISMTLYYKIGESEQAVPLGIFRCDSPKVYSYSTSYECYDVMYAFDKKITSRFTGTAYNLLTFICSECGVELANTASDISGMINSAQTLTIDPERVLTYRDALSYISMLLGGYCIIDRQGKLSVRTFHKTSDMSLPRHRRETTSFSGYKTVFCGVKCRFLAEQNFYPYEITAEGADGILLDLGDIPIVSASDSTKWTILQNIYDHITDYEYYPCEIDMVGDPSIEAGDMITTPDRNGYAKNILLTSVTFTWRGTSQIVSEGTDPKLEAVSTAEKKNQAQQDAIAKASQVVTATYINGMEYTLDTEYQEISSLRFSTVKDLTAIFGAEIPVYSSGDGYVEIAYVDAGEIGDVVKARVQTGYNLITLVNHLPYDSNRVVLLQLKAKAEALSSGGTVPTVTISQDTIRSYIFAQGIEADQWDGIITISETIEYVEATMALYGLTESVSVAIQTPVAPSFSEVIGALTSEMQSYSLSDTISITLEIGEEYLRCGAGHRAGNGRMFAPLII